MVRMTVSARIVMDQATPTVMQPVKEKSQLKYMTVMIAVAMHPIAISVALALYVTRYRMPAR